MPNWAAENVEPRYYDDRREGSEDSFDSEEERHFEEEALWDKAETKVTVEADADGNRYEVCKKVLVRHVDRPIVAADIRARFTRFGKADPVKGSKQSDLVSNEPPLALELGTVDAFERESRNEVKRMMHEVSNADVQIKDVHLAKIDKEERMRRMAPSESSPTSSTAGETWGSGARAARTNNNTNDRADEVNRRIRVTNVSDAVTEDNLRLIFGEYGNVERVFLSRDRETGQVKGYAFVTFSTAAMAESAIAKKRINFKNVVMTISKAIDRN